MPEEVGGMGASILPPPKCSKEQRAVIRRLAAYDSAKFCPVRRLTPAGQRCVKPEVSGSFAGLHGAVAQSVSPHFMVTLSDDGNMFGQLYTVHRLVGVGEDQTVAPFGVSGSPMVHEVKRNPCCPDANEVSKWSDWGAFEVALCRRMSRPRTISISEVFILKASL